MANKFMWTGDRDIQAIRNDALACKDCFHRSPRTDICAVYQHLKPKSILEGAVCEYYRKDIGGHSGDTSIFAPGNRFEED